MKRPWAPVAPTILALLATSVAIAPSASAAPNCTASPLDATVELTAFHITMNGSDTDLPSLAVSADATTTCGVLETVNIFLRNSSTQVDLQAALVKKSDDGTTASFAGNFSVDKSDAYGSWITNDAAYILHASDDPNSETKVATIPLDVEYNNRYVVTTSAPAPLLQEVNEGDTVKLSGKLLSTGYLPEKVELQIKEGNDWTIQPQKADVAAGATDFSFDYKPTQTVEYRYAYRETGWGTQYESPSGVLQVKPVVPPAKVPSAPSAFIRATTASTISLDWSVPADANGTISAYRFGWRTPSGKPVPSWEDTYPVSGGLIDPFVFTKLAPNTEYTVWVEAVNENGRSKPTEITVKTKAATTKPPVIKPPVKPKPRPTLKVKVKAVSNASKFYIDVDPNRRGAQFYTFIIQKKRGSAWENYPDYHTAFNTQGKQETRKINLPRGTYRAVVYPKYGYRGTVSKSVFLKK